VKSIFVTPGGEYVADQGASCSGKSTLDEHSGFSDLPTGGRYILPHATLLDSDTRSRRGAKPLIGFVFQLQLDSAHERPAQLELPLVYAGIKPRATSRTSSCRARKERRRIATVGRATGLTTIRLICPGGQQQRVAVARSTYTTGDHPADETPGQPRHHVNR